MLKYLLFMEKGTITPSLFSDIEFIKDGGAAV
jgi:hypothetical protein